MGTVILEGLHALKHASRFGARITEILTDDLDKALELADGISDDLRPLVERAQVISTSHFRERATQPIPTHVLAYAERPTYTLEQCMPTAEKPTILLDDPRNSKNLGAVVRVGAAVGAAGVLAHGPADFFNPMAVRGGAGLQWAIPCWSGAGSFLSRFRGTGTGHCDTGDGSSLSHFDTPEIGHEVRPFTLVGLDADAPQFQPCDSPNPTIFAFGSERSGLSDEVRSWCDQIVSLPMEPHVSSLNLATSVSAVLYLRRYSLSRDQTI
ncbi:MAG: hypothetical protein LBG99_07235 [Propionibacteriaceae bacterium]|jgi:TrmH family RNA methyltransferase|nr:hypothetical protein [Propionibacteriaceae bacterium]